MPKEIHYTTSGMGCSTFCFLLTLILFVSKIFGLYNITWIWVFSPLWIPMIILISVILIFIFIGLLTVLVAYLIDK